MSRLTLFLALFTLTAVCAQAKKKNKKHPYLSVIAARTFLMRSWAPLKPGFTVTCPMYQVPITLECVAPKAKWARFYLNDKLVRIERKAPFIISGNTDRFAFPWKAPRGKATVQCVTDAGSVKLSGFFECGGARRPRAVRQAKKKVVKRAAPKKKAVKRRAPKKKAVRRAAQKKKTSPVRSFNRRFLRIAVRGKMKPSKRHEACAVYAAGKVWILGGRNGRKHVNSFNPRTLIWSMHSYSPIELHHFQCVAVGPKIYLVGGWTGRFPVERTLPYMLVYDTRRDSWGRAPVPKSGRNRGCGAVGVRGGKIYLASGGRGGHGKSNKLYKYFDVFDTRRPGQGWRPLPNAPHARDHAGGAVVGNLFCVAGGRLGDKPNFWSANVAPIDCYNFTTRKWNVMRGIKKPRGGVAVGATCQGKILIAGGEAKYGNWGGAFADVDVFDPRKNKFEKPLRLARARHGTGMAVAPCSCGAVYVPGGSGNIGGGPELNDIEVWSPYRKLKYC